MDTWRAVKIVECMHGWFESNFRTFVSYHYRVLLKNYWPDNKVTGNWMLQYTDAKRHWDNTFWERTIWTLTSLSCTVESDCSCNSNWSRSSRQEYQHLAVKPVTVAADIGHFQPMPSNYQSWSWCQIASWQSTRHALITNQKLQGATQYSKIHSWQCHTQSRLNYTENGYHFWEHW